MTGNARAAHGCYVYGVAPAGAAVPGIGGIMSGEPVRAVVHGDLQAVVSPVELDTFTEERLAEMVADRDRLEAAARAHEAVLSAVIDNGDLVPLRFGTVYRDESAVAELLAASERTLLAALGRVRGAREWGVKVFGDTDALSEAVRASHPDAPQPDAATGQGTAYFQRKRFERTVAGEAEQLGLAAARDSHERLAAAAQAAALSDPQPPELSGRADRMLLNASYLVRRDEEDTFARALAAVRDDHEPRGVSAELTGPWAPHHFADLDLTERVDA